MAQQSFDVLGTIIPTKQRNISRDLNHDKEVHLRGNISGRKFVEVSRRFRGTHCVHFIKLIFSCTFYSSQHVSKFLLDCRVSPPRLLYSRLLYPTIKVKVKFSRYRPEKALGDPGG